MRMMLLRLDIKIDDENRLLEIILAVTELRRANKIHKMDWLLLYEDFKLKLNENTVTNAADVCSPLITELLIFIYCEILNSKWTLETVQHCQNDMRNHATQHIVNNSLNHNALYKLTWNERETQFEIIKSKCRQADKPFMAKCNYGTGFVNFDSNLNYSMFVGDVESKGTSCWRLFFVFQFIGNILQVGS